MPSVLCCTVRGCGEPLEAGVRAFRCPRGHAFDRARGGHVNLLQPQDRRSRKAGDSKAAVEARARSLERGAGRALVDALVRRAVALELGQGAVVVDLGSGTGDVLGSLARERPIVGIGIDLSTAAAGHAARRFPRELWVVANADRRLPVCDASAALVLSVHGRRAPEECARILAPGGHLLAALPAPDDLIELRRHVQGAGLERERSTAFLAEHEGRFAPVERFTVRQQLELEREGLLDLLAATYRGERASLAERVAALERLEVTLASECFLLARR